MLNDPITTRGGASYTGSRVIDGKPAIGGTWKRTLDIIVAVTALLLLSPLMLLTALAIAITMGRPVLFAQRRVGLGGAPFFCYKFRTMSRDAERRLSEHLRDNPAAAAEWRENRKLRHDPRVTLVGQTLRLTSLDELPQLFNVLGGEMSCVGPRPVVPDELALYGRYIDDYLAARPGMTGPWQVSGRNALSYADRVALDSHYVRNWSLWTDVTILARTIPAVARSNQTS